MLLYQRCELFLTIILVKKYKLPGLKEFVSFFLVGGPFHSTYAIQNNHRQIHNFHFSLRSLFLFFGKCGNFGFSVFWYICFDFFEEYKQ